MKNRTWKLLFWAYLLFLFLVVILKFTGSFQALVDRMHADPYGKNHNLVPFSTIRVQLRYISDSWAQFNLLGNTVPFIPFGFLLPTAYRKARSLLKVLLWGFAFVVFAECTQYFLNLGTFDVDDIILNMGSFFLGYLPVGIASLFRKPKKKRKK